MNSAGTFIDILQECKRKNKKIFVVRKLYRSATECDLSIYGILLILHLFHVFYMDACTDHEFSSRDEELTLASWLTCAPKVNCTLSLESILNDIIFVYLKVTRNREARKCLIKTHLTKGTRAISIHFPTLLRKKNKTKTKKLGWTLIYRNVAIKCAPHEQRKTGSLCSRRKASVLHLQLSVHAQCHAQVQNNTHVQPYVEDNRES